jgi:Domain of unknown function (DUF4145)
MQCPTCGQHTPDAWKGFRPLSMQAELFEKNELNAPQPHASRVWLDWMHCANNDCRELVIRVHEGAFRTVQHGGGQLRTQLYETRSWQARPRGSQRPLDPLVTDPLARDYREAAAILDISPRMSAVLSRRILSDILAEYAGQTDFNLTDRIKGFVNDTSQPSSVRENLHYLREIGNFSAHTQTNDQAEIIDVDRAEAEWTLTVIDRLFDHFIIGPERDRRMREAMDEKIKEAGRPDVPPLPDSDGTP